MRCKDDCLIYYIRKLIGDSIGAISVAPTITNEVTLYDTINSGQVVEAGNKNLCNANSITVIPQYVFYTIVYLDLFLVEYTLGANKESTILWICAEDYSWGTINLDTNRRIWITKPIQN